MTEQQRVERRVLDQGKAAARAVSGIWAFDSAINATMHGMHILVRMATLFGLVAVVLSACGSSQAITPTPGVVGPALIFFYTDN